MTRSNSSNPAPLKIAIASSGLAHIRRGVETWAQDLGVALRRRGIDATTFQGSANPSGPSGSVVPCWKRTDPKAERLIRLLRPIGGWRLGFGTGYGVEQSTFAFHLWPRIARHYDILHVQDPQLAQIFEYLHRAHLSRPRVILAHGTEESSSLLRQYSWLQHLAPNYLEDWEPQRPPRQEAFAIPNPVDVDRFRPGDRYAIRAALGLPQDSLVIVSVGALKKTHKRMDFLIREFSHWRRTQSPDAILVIIGAHEPETEQVLRLGAELEPKAVRFLQDAPREQVIQFLQTADIFTLASLHEMLGTAILEGMACGLPIACNDSPTFRWIVGEAGSITDISQTGALAAQFSVLADPLVRARMSLAARARAQDIFSERAVVDATLAMYRRVAESS